MNSRVKQLLRSFAWVMVLAPATVLAAARPAEPADRSEIFTGSLVNLVAGARASQPFILAVDRVSSDADLQRLSAILAARGPYSLRDALWKLDAGYLRVGGGIGYPVAAVFSRQTASGRTLMALLNRPLGQREIAFSTRSSRYPFTWVELHLGPDGKGEGQMIAAAQLQLDGNQLDIESLGIQPIRLLHVKAG